jgi:hypothetical protein
MDGFFVYIIESPSPQDLLDGRTEGRSLQEAFQLSRIPHVYNLVTNKEMFLEVFSNRLEKAVRSLNRLPVVHISVHGSPQGIELTDGTPIYWDELRQILCPLEQAAPGQLLLCMSSCFGFSGSRMVMLNPSTNELPFSALVGNSHKPSWSDAAVAYITLYHLLFKQVPLAQAVEAMKIASGDSNFWYTYGHEVQQLCLAYEEQQKQEEFIQGLRAGIQSNPSWRRNS